MSLRQAAIANNINLSTAKHRIKRGWDKIDALIIPPNYQRKVTDQQVIECEKLGLTYIESAKHLKVQYMTLVSRINKMGINWRGKGKQIGAKQ